MLISSKIKTRINRVLRITGLLFWLAIIGSSGLLYSATDDEELLKLLSKGDELFEKERYDKALELYEQADVLYQNDPLIRRRIAITLVKLENYQEAFPLLTDLTRKQDSCDLRLNFSLAETYRNLGQYGKALETYSYCKENYENCKGEISRLTLDDCIKQCEYNYGLPLDTVNISVRRLGTGVNSAFQDYHPLFVPKDSSLIFTSKRPDSYSFMEMFSGNDEDIYISQWQYNKWGNARPLRVSEDLGGNMALVGKANKSKEWFLYSELNYGDLYYAYLEGDRLIVSSPVAELNTKNFTENSITLDEKNERCFFVSNRTDLNNYGGRDIFIATKNPNGTWGNIQNAGPAVNTEDNEDFVFWNEEESALYFSSDREMSVGGYDIFYSQTDESGNLKESENLGFPVNTVNDDISYYRAGNLAWYSRKYNQDSEDLFEITYYPEAKPQKGEWTKLNISGIIPIDDFEVIEDIYFNVGECNLDLADSSLIHLSNVLKNTRNTIVRLSGYADYRGDEMINNKLSFKRAANLAEFLIDNGVNPGVLKIEAFGESQTMINPELNPEKLDKILQINRTVQITVEKQGTPYLYVNKKLQNSKNEKKSGRYSVMCHISREPVDIKCPSQEIQESYADADGLFYYHSTFFSSIKEAQAVLKEIRKTHPGAYLFDLGME